MTEAQMLTVEEARALLGVSRVRICQLARAGKLEGVKRAGAWFFTPEVVRQAIERRASKGEKKTS